MKKNYIFHIVITLLLSLFCACNEEDKDIRFELLTVDRTEVSLNQEQNIKVKIVSGNGGYTVSSKSEAIATASINGDEITITASNLEEGGETVIIIRDQRDMVENVKVSVRTIWDITLSDDNLSFIPEEEKVIYIATGNQGYAIDFADEESKAIVELNTDQLEAYGAFAIKGIAVGEARLTISDRLGKTLTITVTVDILPIEIDKHNLSLVKTKESKNINITRGTGGYTLELSNPQIVSAVLDKNKVTITPLLMGNTTLTIKGQYGDQAEVQIEVADIAADLGAEYCLVIDTPGSAQANDLKNLKQVTYEILFYSTGTRGLMTFMGLEGNLILRGIGDQNPIFEISGDAMEVRSRQTLRVGKWYHIAVVFDGDGSSIEEKYKMYIDGVKEDLEYKTPNTFHTTVDLTKRNGDPGFMIGRAYNTDWRAFYGCIAEARVWKVARSESEIKNNMCTLDNYNKNDMVGHWVFNTGIATGAFSDLSGHQLDATVYTNNPFAKASIAASRFVEKKCVK